MEIERRFFSLQCNERGPDFRDSPDWIKGIHWRVFGAIFIVADAGSFAPFWLKFLLVCSLVWREPGAFSVRCIIQKIFAFHPKETFMRTTIKSAVTAAAFVAAATMATGSFAAEGKGVDTFNTNRYTQALIDRMDTSKDGKVSKAEFMKFMEAEWNALDKNKNGVLETLEFQNREYFQRVEPN